jgi:hypothetical protein
MSASGSEPAPPLAVLHQNNSRAVTSVLLSRLSMPNDYLGLDHHRS